MDVYKAPVAQVSVPHEIQSRPVRGVILGALADLLLSTVLFVGFALAMGAYMASKGASENQIAQFLISIEHDNAALAASYLIGGASSAVGGYICARNARVNEYRYGCVLASLLSVLSVAFESEPVLMLTGIALTWIAVLTGCHWGRQSNRHELSSAQ